MSYQPEYNSYVSTDNSSTTLLTNGSTFTGTWEDVSKYDSVVIAPTTDQDGIYYIDFSPDGTNVDSTLTRYYNTADISAPHRFSIARKYFRVRFTNDSGSDQTYLRLQSSVKASIQNLNVPLDGTISRDYDSTSVRPTNYHYEVANGLRQGEATWNKFGYNLDVDTAAEEVIASFGGTFTILTTASTLEVVSASANDTSAGTGARTVLITGIDANSEPVSETVIMNGVTAVTTTASFLGVNRAVVLSSGSGNTNAGTISITATTGGTTQAEIPNTIISSVTQQAIFHTAVGTPLLVDWLWINALKISGGGGSPVVNLKAYSYSRVTETTYEVFRGSIDTGVDNTLELKPSQPLVIGGNEVLYFTATTDVNNTSISVRFSGIASKTASV